MNTKIGTFKMPHSKTNNDSIAAVKAWNKFKSGYMNRTTHPATGKPIDSTYNQNEYDMEKNEFYYDTDRRKLRLVPTDDGEIPIEGFKEGLKKWQLPPVDRKTPLNQGVRRMHLEDESILPEPIRDEKPPIGVPGESNAQKRRRKRAEDNQVSNQGRQRIEPKPPVRTYKDVDGKMYTEDGEEIRTSDPYPDSPILGEISDKKRTRLAEKVRKGFNKSEKKFQRNLGRYEKATGSKDWWAHTNKQ